MWILNSQIMEYMNDLMSKFTKHSFLCASILLSSLTLESCSTDDTPMPEEPPLQEGPTERPSTAVKVVTMSAENILSGNGKSRVAFTLESDKLKFVWAEGDKIGVCPSSGTQIAFTIKSGAGNNSAQFDGGAWALRNTETYAAYYPYDVNNAANENRAEIPFSYDGQVQNGNASLEHLGTHDLMATNATGAVEDKLNFQFKHLNSVAQFRLTVPVAATFKNLTIRCNENIFAKVANLDLSGENYAWSVKETTNELRMSLSDIASTEESKELIFYMMLPPTDMDGKTVYVVLHSDDNKVYQGQLASRTMEAGYAYSFGATMEDVTVSQLITSPSFGTSDTEIN